MAESVMRTAAWYGAFARRLCCGVIFLLGTVQAVPIAFAEGPYDRVDALMASQAWQLALHAIDSIHNDDAFSEEVERRRITIYRHLLDTAALTNRIEQLPPETSQQFYHWALEQLFEASLETHDLPRADTAVKQLLVFVEEDEANDLVRRLVRAYLNEGRAQEALAVLAPFSKREALATLHAEVLLQLKQYGNAFERVAGLTSPEARLWRLTAAMRLGLYAPADAVQELSLLVRELDDQPDLQWVAWVMRAQAARQAGQLLRQVNSLEQALKVDRLPTRAIVSIVPDDLWSAYLAFGRHLALTESLALGQETLDHADTYLESSPYSACALYAWNAIESNDEEVRAEGHRRLVSALQKRKLTTVMRRLYAGSNRFLPDGIPVSVQYYLMSEALSRRDLRAAAKYARNLTLPPPEESVSSWDLRRARVMLYGEDPAAAIRLLKKQVAEEEFDVEFAQRFLQVVFDVQAVGRHEDALALLEAVYKRVDNERMHREILYWEAESKVALGRFADAAELYLRSARYGDHDGKDPWGHSARFRAAEALAQGGLNKDAETLYRELLRETADPGRRRRIEQNIERLWLPKSIATTP